MKFEQKINCPLCGKEMKIHSEEIELKYFGKVLISYGTCSNCGYRYNDVFCLEKKYKEKHEIKIKRFEDLFRRVVKSRTAKVIIPELNIEIKPGPASQGFITNVEGLILRIKNKLIELKNLFEDKEKVEKVISELDKVIKLKREITLIIEDPFGNSAILDVEASK